MSQMENKGDISPVFYNSAQKASTGQRKPSPQFTHTAEQSKRNNFMALSATMQTSKFGVSTSATHKSFTPIRPSVDPIEMDVQVTKAARTIYKTADMKTLIPEAIEAANSVGVNPDTLVNRGKEEFRAEAGETAELGQVRYDHYCKSRKRK